MNDSVAASRKRTVYYKSRAVFIFLKLHSCVKLIFEKLIFETCNSARYKPNFRERVMNERKCGSIQEANGLL